MRNRIKEEFEILGLMQGYHDDPAFRSPLENAIEVIIENFYQAYLNSGVTVDGVAHEFVVNKDYYQNIVEELYEKHSD